MSPILEFVCPTHGKFEVRWIVNNQEEGIPNKAPCSHYIAVHHAYENHRTLEPCGESSPRIPTVPAPAIVEGGTEAGKGR